jgi:hypothetical protein
VKGVTQHQINLLDIRRWTLPRHANHIGKRRRHHSQRRYSMNDATNT